jgi:hypothetical protein
VGPTTAAALTAAAAAAAERGWQSCRRKAINGRKNFFSCRPDAAFVVKTRWVVLRKGRIGVNEWGPPKGRGKRTSYVADLGLGQERENREVLLLLILTFTPS